MSIPAMPRILNGFDEIEITDDEVTECVKKMLDEPIAACSITGLPPFYASNKPSAVKTLTLCFFDPSPL